MPNLVTKYSVIQKISFQQTFTDILNLHCDLDHKHSNPIFPQDTPAYDAVLSNQVWLKTGQQFRKYNRNSPTVTLKLNTEPIFLQDTLAYDAA